MKHLDYIADKNGKNPLDSSTVTRLINKMWEPMYVSANTIRKIYANDVRKKHKGKLSEEMEACSKLDHGMTVHNSNYIKY
mgnify:CR=1 FL=1